MYEFATMLARDGAAKEMLGQTANAHAQYTRAQILVDALQLEKGLSSADGEQLRRYAQGLRHKTRDLEAKEPALPVSSSLLERLL